MQDFLPAEYGTAASALQAAFTVAEVTSAAEEHLEDGRGIGRTFCSFYNVFSYAWQFYFVKLGSTVLDAQNRPIRGRLLLCELKSN